VLLIPRWTVLIRGRREFAARTPGGRLASGGRRRSSWCTTVSQGARRRSSGPGVRCGVLRSWPAAAGSPGRASSPAVQGLCTAGDDVRRGRSAAGAMPRNRCLYPEPGRARLRRLGEVLAAAERRQAHARAVGDTSRAGARLQRFRAIVIRGYRCIRRMGGGTHDRNHVRRGERARGHAGGAEWRSRPPG